MLILRRNFQKRIVIVVPPSDRDQIIILWPSKSPDGNTDRVNLCFEADRGIQITREEVYEGEKP